MKKNTPETQEHIAQIMKDSVFIQNYKHADSDLPGIADRIKRYVSTNPSQPEILLFNRHWATARYSQTTRHYKAEDVAAISSSIELVTPSHYTCQKLYKNLRECFATGNCSKTYGCLDNIQVTNMAKYLSSIYVSGW